MNVRARNEGGTGEPPLAGRGLGRRSTRGSGWLLRNIDLAVGAGERLGVAGPTGSGKSLLLRALALLDPTDAGEVLWEGRPIRDPEVPSFRSKVVYLQQRSPLVEGTVEENLSFAFDMKSRRGTAPTRERLAAIVEATGRDASFLDSRTDHLSGGERQTVALMRALLIDPVVLLLDEPTAALDQVAAATVEEMVTAWLAAEPARRSYVWVSHDSSQLGRMVDRTIDLRDGEAVGR